MSAFCDASKCSVKLILWKKKTLVIILLLPLLLHLCSGMEEMSLQEAKSAFKNCVIRQQFAVEGLYPVMCSYNLYHGCPTQSFGLDESIKGTNVQFVLRLYSN